MQELRKAIPMTSPRQATLHTFMGRDRAQGGKGEESEEALGSEDCEGALEHEDGEQARSGDGENNKDCENKVEQPASVDGKSEDAVEKEEESRNREQGGCAKPPFPCRAQAIPDVSTWKGTV